MLSLHPSKWPRISVCSRTDGTHLDHLISVLLVRLLHGNVTPFPFVINKHLMGRYFQTVNIPFLTKLSSQSLILLIYLYQRDSWFLVLFSGYNLQQSFFLMLKFHRFNQWHPFKLAPVSFDMFTSLLEHFLIHIVLFFLQSWNQPLLQAPLMPLTKKMTFRNLDLDTKCSHCF